VSYTPEAPKPQRIAGHFEDRFPGGSAVAASGSLQPRHVDVGEVRAVPRVQRARLSEEGVADAARAEAAE
jgi:hypothetical protein